MDEFFGTFESFVPVIRVQNLPKNALLEIEATASLSEAYLFKTFNSFKELFEFKHEASLVKIDIYLAMGTKVDEHAI